jgi:CRP-like cAMP-binding protein
VKPRAASVGSSNSSTSTSTSTSTSPNTSTSISTSITSAPKLPSLLSRTKSWWTKNNKSAGISKKEPAACSSPSSILDQDRYTAVVNQAKTLLATGAITANEYTELVNTFDRHLGSSATSSPSASPSPSSSNPSSGGGGAFAAYKREVLPKAAASRQGATVLLDPEAKAEAQRTWLAHALGSHFSAFYKLGKETQDALVGAMEMKIHRAEGGRALMVQGEEGDKMFVIGTGNFDVLVSGNTSSIAKPDAFGEISGELSVAVATLGPGSVCGEIGLLFSSPRNATISLQKEFSTATLYCISRDSFNTAMGKSSKADVLALLKKQFASDPKSRRHGGGGQQIASSEKKSSAEQEKQRRLPDENSRRNRIATPGNLAISDDSVEAPNFAMARSLQESDAALLALHRMAGSCALHRRGSFLNTTTGKRVLDPPTLWRWAIKKIIFQAAVKKTTAFLDSSQTGDLQELFAKAPSPVLVVGRDWDDWLGKEIAILTNKLKNNDIDQTTFDRRVALLEARWSENV